VTASRWSMWRLPLSMAAGGLGGVALGWALGERWNEPELAAFTLGVRVTGELFLAALKALMVPLVVLGMILGVQELGGGRSVRRLAAGATLYFLSTTFLAVLIGLALVTWINPGAAGSAPALPVDSIPERVSALDSIADVVRGLVPANLFDAAARGNVLGLIVASLAFGVALTRIERAAPLLDTLGAANRALYVLVRWVVELAPLGVLALVAERLGRAGGGAAVAAELERLLAYSLTVLAGLALHAFVVLPLLLRLLGGRNPLRYFGQLVEALITALGTASSAATLGVTRRCVVERAGVSARSADFVLPIGATVNMDGTALYEAVAAVFIAQTLGIELDAASLAIVALTATLAAIGAAAIPEAGLVTMVLVLQAVGLPAEGVGLLLAVDWVLDRFRTSVNVWGDAVGAAVLDRTARAPN
jgi:Na+/H+-dicarboxylate symporter